MPEPSSAALDILRLRIATQVAPRNWISSLESLCKLLEAGQTWEQVTDESSGWKAPAALRALAKSAYQCGQPSEVLLEVLRRRSQLGWSWHELIAAILYPMILLITSLAVSLWTSQVISQLFYAQWVVDFGIQLSRVKQIANDQLNMTFSTGLVVGWLLFVLGTVKIIGTPIAWVKLVGNLPLFGRPYRWLRLSDVLSRIMAISTRQPSLTAALRLTAESYGGQAEGWIVRRIAESVESGIGFKQAVHRTILSDEWAGSALALIELDEGHFVDSLARASSLLEQMARQTCERLSAILPLFILLLVGGIIWGTWSSYVSAMALLNQMFL